jgi:hypothetical protein
MGRRELIGPRYGVRPASRSVPLISVSVCLERLFSARAAGEKGSGQDCPADERFELCVRVTCQRIIRNVTCKNERVSSCGCES